MRSLARALGSCESWSERWLRRGPCTTPLIVADGVLNESLSEDDLGGAAVVGFAEQPEVLEAAGSSEGEGDAMVLLEPSARRTTLAVGTLPGALKAVAFANGAACGAVGGGCAEMGWGRVAAGNC